MPSDVNAYNNLNLLESARQTSHRVWFFLLILVAAWCLLIVTPALAADTAPAVAERLYSFFGYICHQLPSRSFHILGHKLGVCSRCWGVYSGLVLGVAAYPVFRKISEIEPISRIWLILSMIPIGIDWSLTYIGIWENTFFTRFTTGLILGVACAVFIVPATSELALVYHMRKNRVPRTA